MTPINNVTAPTSIIPGFVQQGWISFWRAAKRRRQARIDRDAFRTMLGLEEHMLRDIGVTRGDVVWASRLPLSVNAAEELRRLSLSHRL